MFGFVFVVSFFVFYCLEVFTKLVAIDAAFDVWASYFVVAVSTDLVAMEQNLYKPTTHPIVENET